LFEIHSKIIIIQTQNIDFVSVLPYNIDMKEGIAYSDSNGNQKTQQVDTPLRVMLNLFQHLSGLKF